MFNWRDYYKSRTCTAEEAVKCIKSGDNVVVGHACGEPQILTQAMSARYQELENVKVIHRVGQGKSLYAAPGMEGHFRHVSLFAGPSTRQAIYEGRADFIPRFISEIPELFSRGHIPVDVALVSVSPPDQYGCCSLGISVDYTMKAAKSAKIIVAEVNSNMPRTHGDSFLRVEEIDYFVQSDMPLIEIPRPVVTKVEKEIGDHIADLIEDGATLQMGIGAIPDAILSSLHDKHDLGIHTEMFSDGVMELVESGVINCSNKSLHPNKIISTFIMGTKKLYEWVDDNPMIEMHSEDYVNDPLVIMQNNNMISINSALQVDVLGQVAADTMGAKQYSGVGGQVDFIRGVKRTPGGKSIIAIPSTAAKGKISRIVPALYEGTAVTTSRNEVDYIVTEYGVAKLQGKTNQERLKALVNICHPDFRKEVWGKANLLYYGGNLVF
ncbi:MAG: acetyl-CoA hydrolase/transferase C-terminal domain-containing protein [Syntrophomonadaceae bacterium]|nr:acetyl-CoA hydrolase/transferase C-terminal domain-containing protein [Syntrophomonadaceae bacterium]MDD3889216.1 acetyl-CoA hydrolase/transferase C-terminal domain-containing protein [Syntrophomonadaceae bacterium]MDD4549748.1 acetyl-CoA hydrolase/transferase C-terminal domain-containing protein [Syntrophomonadaceae bacterium]